MEKMVHLKLIGDTEFTIRNLICDISWAIIIMLFGYLVVFGTRTLSLFVDFRAMPWITGKVINSKVVERTLYEEVIRERNSYSESYEEQRKIVRILSKDFDNQIEEIRRKQELILQTQTELNNANSEISTLQEKLAISESQKLSESTQKSVVELQLDETKSKLEEFREKLSIEKNLTDSYLNLFFEKENLKFWKLSGLMPPTVISKVKELKSKGIWQIFNSVLNFTKSVGLVNVAEQNKMREVGILLDSPRTTLSAMGRFIEANKDHFE